MADMQRRILRLFHTPQNDEIYRKRAVRPFDRIKKLLQRSPVGQSRQAQTQATAQVRQDFA